jgi:hexosaminidase
MRSVLLLLASTAVYGAPELMPMPAKMTVNSGHLTIDSSFQIAATRYRNPRLDSAMRRVEARIFRQFGFATILPKRTALAIECGAASPDYPVLGEDESYELDVTPEGARLRAPTVTGALRGMETFVQLIGPDFQVPAVHIDDRPRFPWRGLMLDVSRHWMPVGVVKRNLDAMAAVKLNVFHWHLADDQGFRVESKRYPKLQELGSDGNFYTQDEIRDVVAYARDRAIRVIPEFDLPGHATSWLVGYPELASAPGPYKSERSWGIFEPTMNPAREETYAFLDGFIGEMAALFPDPFFHIGGDEVVDKHWENPQDLHRKFTARLQQILARHRKNIVGWDEVLAPNLATGTVIQSWRGQEALADAAKKGYRGILSFGYYLDYLKPASFHYAVDPMSAAGSLSAEEAARILGGEACMWAEYVSAETVDSRVWPRMAAIAERFWSPREVTDVSSMYERMERVSRGLEWTGVRHRESYAPMLDRLGRDLRVLADASEATGIEVRRDARKYTSLVDLNRFVDAVRPESEAVRQLERCASRMEAADVVRLRAAFAQWAAVQVETPAELKALAKNLSSVGAMGSEALKRIETGDGASEEWIAARKKALDEMERPNAEVVLAAARPVRILLAKLCGPASICH